MNRHFLKQDGLYCHYNKQEDLFHTIDLFFSGMDIHQLYIFFPDQAELEKRFIACFNLVEAAGGIVKNRNGEILFIKRLGKWDLPKGKVQNKEIYKATALREVSEECGINNLEIVKTLKPSYHTYMINNTKILKKTQWYEMMYKGNEAPVPQTEEDITEVKWISLSGINQIISNTHSSLLDVLKEAEVLG